MEFQHTFSGFFKMDTIKGQFWLGCGCCEVSQEDKNGERNVEVANPSSSGPLLNYISGSPLSMCLDTLVRLALHV